jgi:hypothetical protein
MNHSSKRELIDLREVEEDNIIDNSDLTMNDESAPEIEELGPEDRGESGDDEEFNESLMKEVDRQADSSGTDNDKSHPEYEEEESNERKEGQQERKEGYNRRLACHFQQGQEERGYGREGEKLVNLGELQLITEDGVSYKLVQTRRQPQIQQRIEKERQEETQSQLKTEEA